MLIEKQALLRVLTAAQKVVERRNTIPILSNVRLVAKDGKLTATATDLDLQIQASAPADGDLSVCVAAHLLFDIARKIGGTEILLRVEGNELLVVSGRCRFKLQTLPVSDFPDANTREMPTAFTADLAALFAPVKFAISTEETRYYLNGIYLHVRNDRLAAVATDGHRLGLNYGAASNDFKGVIVPAKTVGVIPAGEISVRLSDTKIQFAAPGLVITSKLIDGTFPDYQRVIPTGNDKKLVLDRQTFAQAVDRVSTISTERGRAVKLTVEADTLRLAVNNPDAGQADEELAADYSSNPLEIGFNAKYLIDVLGEFPPGDITVSLADGGSPTLFSSDKTPDYLAVIMPMRV